MKIAVLVNPVPATDSRVKLHADGRHTDPAGVSVVVNPYDEFALEEALRLKEKAGEGEVVLLTVATSGAAPTIRNGLAMGADRAVLLTTAEDPEPLQVARALAAEVRSGGYDLVLCGKQAVDDDAQQVPAMLADLLGWPGVTVVAKLEVEGPVAPGTQALAHREIEGGIEEVRFALPAVVAAQKGLNEPRYASLKGIMAAKKKPIDERPAELGAAGLEIVSLTLPKEREGGRIVGEGAGAVADLVRALREEAKVI